MIKDKEGILALVDTFNIGGNITKSRDRNSGAISIYVNDCNDDEIGRILLSEEEEGLYIADYANIHEDFRGGGKALFYLAMDFVYPAWMGFDLTGFSSDANRVHEGLERADFIEKGSIIEGSPSAWYDKKENEYHSNFKFRFKFDK